MNAPPKPALVLRLGVTGHRPNRLSEASLPRLEQQVGEVMALLEGVLAEVQAAHGYVYSAERPPHLRVVSALAQGADTLVAETALARGAELEAPLPFALADYERDFPQGAARERLHHLVGRASAVCELAGSRAREPESYEAVGRLVVKQCDVLLAIWDGEPAAGRGGTAMIVAYAQQLGLPVLWLHATAEQPAGLLAADGRARAGEATLTAFRARLIAMLAPPEREPPPSALRRALGLAEGSSGNLLDDYLAERNPSFTRGRIFPFVRDLAIGHLHLPKLRVAKFAATTGAKWQRDFAAADAALTVLHDAPMARLREHYCWANGLAEFYGGQHRSAFTMNYLLAAFAVLLAALGLVVPDAARLWTVLEMVCLLTIVLITMSGKSLRWHERWLTYRSLAERLRTLRFLIPLAEVPRLPPLPRYTTVDLTRTTWIDWLFRAVTREIGLPNVRLDNTYLAAVGRFIADVEVGGQIDYHRVNAERMRHVDHHLHLAGVALFMLCIVAVGIHLFLHEAPGEVGAESAAAWHVGPWLSLLSAALPAFGSAFYGIRNQGEFANLVERSAATTAALTRLRQRLDAAADAAARAPDIAAAAAEIAEVMMMETADWHQVFGSKPLDLPA
ncbi:MAG: DUF4231 domain-containing protein [Alphaproteobacteria bacterium]